jgi:hypothetical protein
LTARFVAGMVALSMPIVVARAEAEAQAPRARPAGATAECKDGSYSTAKTQQGACSGHGGIATWLATTKDATKTNRKWQLADIPHQCEGGRNAYLGSDDRETLVLHDREETS